MRYAEIVLNYYKVFLINFIGINLPLEVRHDKMYQVIKNGDFIITNGISSMDHSTHVNTGINIKKLKWGTVIIDFVASAGGNVFGSRHDEIITLTNDVKTINVSSLSQRSTN